MLNKLFSRQCYRSPPFWLLVIIALYSLIGFVVLPKIIHNAIIEQVNSQLGWQTNIKSVEFNPFLMTLSINQLTINDAQKQSLSFSRFHADFELRSIIEGAYTFKEITLINPSFHLFINEDGATNIEQALARHSQAKNEAETENHSTSVMPKLLFDNITVKNGSFSVNDSSQGELITHQLNPISFAVHSFSTYVEEGGDYQLHISLGENQSIDWKGRIAVAPIISEGYFHLQGIKIERFWPYLEKYSPYQLRHSNTDLQANYLFSYIDDELQLQLNDALLTISELQLAETQKIDPFVNIKKIQIGPMHFDRAKKSIMINKITIDNIDLDLVRTKNDQLALLAPLNTFLAKQTYNEVEATEQQSNSSFQWSINDISITNSELQITDNFVPGGAKIKIHNIGAELSMLNQSLTNKQPFSLSYQIENSQVNSLTGQLVTQPFSLHSKVKLEAVPVNIIQPYLTEIAHIKIKKGKLSMNGDLSLVTHQSKPLTGNFNGRIDITDFKSFDTLNKRRLLGWDKLSIAPLSVELSPLSIKVKQIALTKPYSRLVITEDREVNFSQLIIGTKSPKTAPQNTSSDPVAKIEIAEITLKDGSAYFADLSLTPQFSTSIQQLNGVIKGLSSNNLESADVNINGNVEEYGKVSVIGKINPLSGDLYSDININFDKIELTTMTPYSGRYAGYVIDKGKLSLDLNYKIANGILDGSNRLILDQFELGDKVSSEESLNLPLKLALALFKDADGVIDLSLPTKGDMNSPDFEIAGIVMKALVNVITKAVTSPFSLLANLVGGDEKSLSSIAFELGSANLNQIQKDNLKTLASLLIERPQLILEMRVNVDSEQETILLQQQLLTELLDLDKKNPKQQLRAMEDLLSELEGGESVETFKMKLHATQDTQQPVEQDFFEQQYQQALYKHLVVSQQVANLQLSELAQRRISSIKKELIKVNKVNNQQIFAQQPSLTASAEGTVINTIFSLTSK